MKSVALRFGLTFAPFLLGCLSCFVLQSRFGYSPILAASLLGFLVTLVPLPDNAEAKPLTFIFCTGTFVAMSSSQIISSYSQVLAISLLGAFMYLVVQPYFSGLGGKMGAIAFVATTLWIILENLA